MIAPIATMDMSKMNRALDLAQEFSSRRGAPEKLLHTTAYFVVQKTIDLMDPRATTVQRIDTELGTAVLLQPKARGKGFKTAKRGQIYTAHATATTAKGRSVPLAALIINARVMGARSDQARQPGMSNYNRRTNMRWARLYSPFKGVSRAAGASAMREAVSRMIKRRHSSIKFLLQGFVEIKRSLRSKVWGGAPATDPVVATGKNEFGEVRAGNSGHSYYVEIANLLGTRPGKHGDNSASINEALHRHAGPLFQQAINEEAEAKIAIYFQRMHDQDIAPKWNSVH